jgi:hypothetical protein
VTWDNADFVASPQFPAPPLPPPPSPSPPPFDASGPASVRFDGVDTVIILENAYDSAHDRQLLGFSDQLTLEAWIKPERFDHLQYIAAGLSDSQSSPLGWAVAIACPDGAGPGCCGDHVNGALMFVPRMFRSTDCVQAKSSTSPLRLNEWQHVAVSVDATPSSMNTRRDLIRRRVDFYIDGVNVGSSYSSDEGDFSPIQVPGHVTHNDQGDYQGKLVDRFHLGAGWCGPSDALDVTRDTGDVFPCGHYLGLMDEMKLWRAALSEVTVRTHLDRGIVPWHVNLPDDGLIAYVTFDAGHGVNISANEGLARDVAADFKLYPAAKEMGMWDSSDHHSVNASPLAAPPPPASPPPRPPPQEGPSVVYFNGVDTTLIASSPDGAMQPGQRLTFQAWIHPLELNRGQVLAMMGSNGWALMLTCNEGSGSACCGDYATHAPGTLMFWTMQNDPKVPRSHCASAPTSTRRVVQNKWQHVAVVAGRVGAARELFHRRRARGHDGRRRLRRRRDQRRPRVVILQPKITGGRLRQEDWRRQVRLGRRGGWRHHGHRRGSGRVSQRERV